MADLKIAHNMAQQKRIMREISEGGHPKLGCKAAPYLPIKAIKYLGSEAYPIVIRQGDLIALDQWNQYVPANGGVTTVGGLVYGQYDVDWGVHAFSNAAAYGIGALATLAQDEDLLANNLIGYAFTDFVSTAVENYLNFQPANPNVTVSTDYLCSFPLTNVAQGAVKQGDMIIPDTLNPGKWRPAVAADFASAAQSLITHNNILGKAMTVEKNTDFLLKADVIQGAPGLNLYGTIDSPAGAGIANYLQDSITVTRPNNSGASTVADKFHVAILVRI